MTITCAYSYLVKKLINRECFNHKWKVFNKQPWVLILFYSASEICPLGERKESRDKSFQFLLQKLIEYQVTLIRGRDRPA